MNREEWNRLLTDTVNDNTVLKHSDYPKTMDALLEAVWLELAQVWDDGYDAGLTDENAGWNVGWDRAITPNPYKGN